MTSNETRLTLAIASLIIPGGISFNIYQKLTFQKVLNLARNMSKDYQPANRNILSMDILDTINDQKMERSLSLIKRRDRYFGLLFLGDNDTISKITLLNILGPGKNLIVAVLVIVNC